jgi:hypothetical protein
MVHAARASAPRATAPPSARHILIGSAAIKIARNSPENNTLNFSNRSKRACESRVGAIHPENQQSRFEGSAPQARFSHVLRSRNHDSPETYHAARFTHHQSPLTNHAFLIATRPELEINLTHSQQTRKPFLIATFSAISAPAPHLNNPLYGFLTATDPNSENWQSHENTRETIF